VPTALTAGRRLQIEYLKRYAPDLARVRWQEKDANLFQLDRRPVRVVARQGLQKVWRAVARRDGVQRNWEVQFLQPTGMAALNENLLRPGMRLHGLIEPADVKAILRDFTAAPRREAAYAVSMLLTLSTWLERYG
jgi:hypothetical protein